MIRICVLLVSLLLPLSAFCEDQASSDEGHDVIHVEIHKNPGCACCDVWADHLRTYGFTVESIEDPGILGFKANYSIPEPLMSCHTAIIDGYFVEGHVPAQDILRLLKEKPDAVTGIAVPGMPLGSPGMEHSRPQDFNTIALLSDGSAYVFESHQAGEDFSRKEKDQASARQKYP